MHSSSRHILSPFEEALTQLRQDVLVMASLVEQSFRDCEKGLLERDTTACNRAISNDEDIDQLEMKIDQTGLALLVRFQPVATDLRRVLSTIKLSGNLERIGDQCTSIARRARKLNDHPSINQIALLGPMFRYAFHMVKESVTAITAEKSTLALEIKASDKKLDLMNREINERITREMAATPDHISLMVHLLFVAGSIERIGDHAKAISEDAVFLVEAEDIRHTKLSITA